MTAFVSVQPAAWTLEPIAALLPLGAIWLPEDENAVPGVACGAIDAPIYPPFGWYDPVGGGVTRVFPPNGPSIGFWPGFTGESVPLVTGAPAMDPVVCRHPVAVNTRTAESGSTKKSLCMSGAPYGEDFRCEMCN